MNRIPEFSGKLRFTEKLKSKDVKVLSRLLDTNWQRHPEWGAPANVQNIPLDFLLDHSGLVYASYLSNIPERIDMVETVNALIRQMKLRNPDFGLNGSLVARSHLPGPSRELFIGEDGFAHEREIKTLECPHCGGNLFLEAVR